LQVNCGGEWAEIDDADVTGCTAVKALPSHEQTGICCGKALNRL